MDRQEIKNILECMVFASEKPLKISKISEILNLEEKIVKNIMLELTQDISYRGLQIMEIGGGYKIMTKPEYSFFVKEVCSRTTKLSQSALETLAIIAYRQPITKPEIEQLRGVNCDGVIDTLLERGLLKIVGRKEVAGRPFIFGTTEKFLLYFGLKNLKDLPPLQEFESKLSELQQPEHEIDRLDTKVAVNA